MMKLYYLLNILIAGALGLLGSFSWGSGWLLGLGTISVLRLLRPHVYGAILSDLSNKRRLQSRLWLYQLFVPVWLALPLILAVKRAAYFNLYTVFAAMLVGRLFDLLRAQIEFGRRRE